MGPNSQQCRAKERLHIDITKGNASFDLAVEELIVPSGLYETETEINFRFFNKIWKWLPDHLKYTKKKRFSGIYDWLKYYQSSHETVYTADAEPSLLCRYLRFFKNTW